MLPLRIMDGALGTLRFCTDATFQHAYIHMRCTGTSTQMQTEEAPRHAASQNHGWGIRHAEVLYGCDFSTCVQSCVCCTGTSTQMQTEEAPRHAAAQDHGWGTKIAGAVKAGAAVAASAAAIQPDAWGLQHAEVLQQDTGETTYFVAGVRSCSRCAFV
jgi:hypothetical protein